MGANTVNATIQRSAVLAACAEMIRACGLTLAEIAQHLAEPPQPAMLWLPVVDQPASVSRPPPAKPELSEQARAVLDLANRPEGVTIADICDALQMHTATAAYHADRLVGMRLLTKVKVAGQLAMRYWSNPAHALEYVEARKQQADEKLQAEQLAAEERRRQAAAAAAARDAEAAAARAKREQARAARLEAAAAPKPAKASRTERATKGKDNITFSPPKIDDTRLRPAGEPVITADTKITRDTQQRPTARWQMRQEAPDERWPSFAAVRPGIDPATGKAWEARA